MKTRNLFFLLLFVSPGFWWLVSQPGKVISSWRNTPTQIHTKVASYTSEERVLGIQDMRWAQVDVEGPVSVISKVFYNRFLVVPDEILDFTTFISPKFYFQAGDGSELSPPGVEPIAAILFPFFVVGLVAELRQRKYAVSAVALLSGFIAYINGKKTIAYLFPILFCYIYFSARGIQTIANRKMRLGVIGIVVAYSIYMLIRAIVI